MNPYYTPHVIIESAEAMFLCPPQDFLFTNKRSIEVVGEINTESVHSIILQLKYLQQADPEALICIHINSPGGSVVEGLALYDVMQAISCPIRTVCVGMAASMGALLFAAGDKRDMLPHAEIMIHDPLVTTGINSKSALSLQEESQRLMKIRQTTAEILAKHSGHSIDEIYEKTKTDTYFTADEAVAFGLADRIIHEI